MSGVKAYTRISVHSHSRHPNGNVKLIGQWGKLGISAFGRLQFFSHGNDRSKLCAFDRVDQQLLVFDMSSSSSIVPDTILSSGTFRAERQNFFSLNPLGFVFKPSLFAPIWLIMSDIIANLFEAVGSADWSAERPPMILCILGTGNSLITK